MSDWRALVDILLAVLDPRLAPLWLAALAGAWAWGIGGSRVPRGSRWVGSLALLSVLNIVLYWVCIPYRTQQRFMLQSLGLAAVPLARLLEFRALGRHRRRVSLNLANCPKSPPIASSRRGHQPLEPSSISGGILIPQYISH